MRSKFRVRGKNISGRAQGAKARELGNKLVKRGFSRSSAFKNAWRMVKAGRW